MLTIDWLEEEIERLSKLSTEMVRNRRVDWEMFYLIEGKLCLANEVLTRLITENENSPEALQAGN